MPAAFYSSTSYAGGSVSEHYPLATPLYKEIHTYLSGSTSAVQDILLAHAIINEKDDIIRSLLDSGSRCTFAHMQLLAELGLRIPYGMKEALLDGSPFRRGKIDSVSAKYRYDNDPEAKTEEADDPFFHQYLDSRDRVEILDSSCSANKLLLREVFRVKQKHQEELQGTVEPGHAAASREAGDDDDDLFLPTAAARKHWLREASKGSALNLDPKPKKRADEDNATSKRKNLPRRSATNVDYSAMLTPLGESDIEDDESDSSEDLDEVIDLRQGADVIVSGTCGERDTVAADSEEDRDSEVESEIRYEDDTFLCDEILQPRMRRKHGHRRRASKDAQDARPRRYAKWFRKLSTEEFDGHLATLEDNLLCGLRSAQQHRDSLHLQAPPEKEGELASADADPYGLSSSDGPMIEVNIGFHPPKTVSLKSLQRHCASAARWLLHLKALAW